MLLCVPCNTFCINIRLHCLYSQLCSVLRARSIPFPFPMEVHSTFWLRHRFMRLCLVFILIRPISFARSTSNESHINAVDHTLSSTLRITYHVSISCRPQHNCVLYAIHTACVYQSLCVYLYECKTSAPQPQLRESTRANVNTNKTAAKNAWNPWV